MSTSSASAAAPRREDVLAGFAFRLGGAVFVCDAAAVEAVVATTVPTPLPRVPAHVLGLVDHDHRALAVLDLARFLALEAPAEASPRTLALHAGGLHVGVPVDVALGVVHVPASARRAHGGAFGPRAGGFLVGECETPHGLAGWLDLARLLEAARV